ncbi:LpxI family protein [Terrihabitans rhizophilus]|uniref:UDP-2,3-diacylglucosamine diphosphatase LpxI n=1 Tax=Terrihabitans rhizophilus TaxID=3092662 RepID=A0ABU4RKU4_9HYPH|nr:UDP-2,3-diacylglucosamine diphosphatase LpxI [Terrihabitans sp. PJ23]MDX6805463.1 UDP-2,3-diacylglucosamine diphosphatase LpxI [Terrihabitans sp. PJ23]
MPAGGSPEAPLAILCGAGAFPLAVAEEVRRTGRPVFLIGILGSSDPAIEHHPHAWARLGQFGRLVELARGAGARDIVFVGALSRPAGWLELRPDRRLLMLVPRLLRALRGGDDHLLRAVVGAVAEHGLQVRGVHEVAPGLMLPAGPLGQRTALDTDTADAVLGFRVLAAMSPFDVGQGAVIANGRVVAVEAAEGTDAMLVRVAELRASGRLRLPARAGVFVKAAKAGQDLRMDTPAIGPKTVESARAAGLAGIAYAAGDVMAVDAERMIASADAAGLFIQGYERERA